MKRKSKLFYKIAAVLSIIMTLTVATPINAKLKDDDKITKISKKQATELALKNNVSIQRIDTGLNTLIRKLKDTHELSDNVKKFEENLILFKQLSNKYMTLMNSPEGQKMMKCQAIQDQMKALDKTAPDYQLKMEQLGAELKENAPTPKELETFKRLDLTPQEKATLKALSAQFAELFGPDFAKMQLTKKDEYEMMVKPRDVLWYMVDGKLRQTKLLKEMASKKVELGVNELYNGILQMQEGYGIKKKLYDKQTKEYNQMIIRKNVGDASEIERMTSETELKKLELDLNKMQRDIDNLEIKLKQVMGMNMKQKIELTDKDTDTDTIRDVKDYDVYLNDALQNRSEINTAKADVDVNQWTIEKMDDYFESDDIEYQEAKDALEDAQTAVDDAKDDIAENIEFAYNDVAQTRLQIDLARKKLDEMKTQYDAAYNGYKNGVKPLSVTWTVELGMAKAQFDLKQAIMNYNNAELKLEAASKVGPKYETRGASK